MATQALSITEFEGQPEVEIPKTRKDLLALEPDKLAEVMPFLTWEDRFWVTFDALLKCQHDFAQYRVKVKELKVICQNPESMELVRGVLSAAEKTIGHGPLNSKAFRGKLQPVNEVTSSYGRNRAFPIPGVPQHYKKV